MCILEEHFCEETKNDCALVFPAEAGYSWEGAEIWSSQAGWSKELRLAGFCHVPQGSGCPQFRERLLSDYSSASRNAKVRRGSHFTTQRKEDDAIPSPLCRGEIGNSPIVKPQM